MSTAQTWHIDSTSSAQTEQIAADLGKNLRGGEVIELVSDLGGGKTTFTRGLVHGAKSVDAVSSPSFTISKVYQAQHFDIHHFDFYRLLEPGIIADELAEVLGDPHVVTVVEWGAIVRHVLPKQRLTITIEPTSENGRRLSFRYPESLAYLLKGVA